MATAAILQNYHGRSEGTDPDVLADIDEEGTHIAICAKESTS